MQQIWNPQHRPELNKVHDRSGNKYLVMPCCFICFVLIVAPALAECQKYGMVLHLHQAITRSVQNGLHKQACPYSVNFSMQIHFGPTLQHKVLLASVYERKLKYSFLRTGTVLDIRKSQLLANYFTKEL